MALEATFLDLSVSLHQLLDAVNELLVGLGDTPRGEESALADGVEMKVLDRKGKLQEARKAAVLARKAVEPPVDMDQARRTLTACQQSFHHIEQLFASELVSYEKLTELAVFASERRAWLPWSSVVKQGIEQCRQPLEQSSRALASCWQELAERLGTTSISVHAKNVGQQITVPRSAAEELEIEGVT